MSNSERHCTAARQVQAAIRSIKKAIEAEGDLEWGGILRESLEDLQFVGERLQQYASAAQPANSAQGE